MLRNQEHTLTKIEKGIEHSLSTFSRIQNYHILSKLVINI
jgi:hypothetical protein